MGKTVKLKKKSKSNWFAGLKSEFKKIIWPDQKALVKRTIAVVTTAIALGIFTSIVDSVVKFGIDKLVNL